MKKDFMSPKCFLNAKHNAASPKGFGENGFDRPKMDVGDAQKLLESLKKNGLEGEDERALDIVRMHFAFGVGHRCVCERPLGTGKRPPQIEGF